MGSFSWLYADNGLGSANIRYGKPFKLMLPEEARKETGFVSLADDYSDYGILSVMGKTFDLYELLAVWNRNMPYKEGKVADYLKGVSEGVWMKNKDEHTDDNREIGIDISYDKEDELIYPLKLAHDDFKGLYEDIPFMSYEDPNQGCDMLTWSEYFEKEGSDRDDEYKIYHLEGVEKSEYAITVAVYGIAEGKSVSKIQKWADEKGFGITDISGENGDEVYQDEEPDNCRYNISMHKSVWVTVDDMTFTLDELEDYLLDKAQDSIDDITDEINNDGMISVSDIIADGYDVESAIYDVVKAKGKPTFIKGADERSMTMTERQIMSYSDR